MDLDGSLSSSGAGIQAVPLVVAPSTRPDHRPSAAAVYTSLDAVAPTGLYPAIYDVLQHPATTIRHIPSAAILSVAVLLESLILDLVAHPSWETAHRFFCFPKLVLRAGRGGKGKSAQSAADIVRRVRLFENADLALLWSELQIASPVRGVKPHRPTTRSQTSVPGTSSDPQAADQLPQSMVDTIKGLVQEGAMGKAAKHLLSEGLADSTEPAIAEKLRLLHPTGTPVSLGDAYALPVHVSSGLSTGGTSDPDWARLVQDAISSFPPGSAPGPSGLRPCHLRDCMRKPGQASSLLQAITSLVTKAVEGLFPLGLAPLWCASNLIPLAKKDVGVRPIAVGDTFRRLMGKVLLKAPLVQTQSASLRPRQTGVGVPMACDLISMGVQSVAQSTDTDWVVLQIDMRNAFNSVSRQSMLEVARAKVPSTYNWLAWCYATPCPLFCQGKLLTYSSQGVHQGDAMGPLGFSLGLEQVLDRCALPQSCLTWSAWYLDDGVAVGSLSAISNYLNTIHEEAAKAGLSLNLAKCQLWVPGLKVLLADLRPSV